MILYVLDIDGTLTDSVPLHQKCYLQAYSELKIPEVNTNWGSYKHHTDSWIFAEVFRKNFGSNPNNNEREEFASEVSCCFNDSVDENTFCEIPGARKFFKKLQLDARLAYTLATGSFRQPANKKLDLIGLESPQELLVTASEFETREDILRHAISAAHSFFNVADFEQIISIGDGYWDFITARNLKINFIGIGSGQAAEKLKSAGVTNVFPNFLTNGIIDCYTGN